MDVGKEQEFLSKYIVAPSHLKTVAKNLQPDKYGTYLLDTSLSFPA